MDWFQIASAIGGMATAIGVGIGAWQVSETRKLARSSFEDGLVKEYRKLTRALPTDALMGLPLSEQDHRESLDDFFRYFDLCNEQVFLRDCGRISDATWKMWTDGIVANMRRPAFWQAWKEVSLKAGHDTFSELRAYLTARGLTAVLASASGPEEPSNVAQLKTPA